MGSYQFIVLLKLLAKNHFRLDSDALQAAEAESAPPPPPLPVLDTDTSHQLVDKEFTSQHQMETSPISKPSLMEEAAQALVDLQESLVDFEETAAVFAESKAQQQELDTSHVIQALDDHSYSMLPPQDSDFNNVNTYEENLLISLEHGGVEGDLEMQVESDPMSNDAHDELNQVPSPEVSPKKQASSRIPIGKSNSNSVSGVRNSKSHGKLFREQQC